MNLKDKEILQSLAKQYIEICANPVQEDRRNLWRAHNSLKKTKPLIYVRAFAWEEMPQSRCLIQDPVLREIENYFRRHIFWNSLNDDSVFEPWVNYKAIYKSTAWGISGTRQYSDSARGAFKIDYPIKDLEDINKMRIPKHEIDEITTNEHFEKISEAIGDIIPVNIDRSPWYWMWGSDISTELGYLRGIEHVMMDMLLNPEWLHNLLKFMSDGIVKTHEEAEVAGDWSLTSHMNQAMTYAEDLMDPDMNVKGVKRDQLWCFMAAQELTAVSPEMHDEFMLQYQLPIMKPFGLVAYGCCEDLSLKIDILRQIPNLRRIAVSPFADVASCAEQIAQDYVFSYRPSPADMVSYGFDKERIKSILTNDLKSCRDCHVDITLKDVETVEKDPERVREWVSLTRRVIDEVF